MSRYFADDNTIPDATASSYTVPDYTASSEGSGVLAPADTSTPAPYVGPGSPDWGQGSSSDYQPPSYAPPPAPDGAYTGPGSIYWAPDNSSQPSNSEPSTIPVSQASTGVQGAQPAGISSTDWSSLFTGVGKGLVNIFGQKVGGQAPSVAAPKPAIPVWVWVAVPLVGVALLAVLIRSARPSAAVAGYRRKSRRSRK